MSHALPQLALERNGNNAVQRRYTYGLRRLRQANGTASYYAYDGLGSVAGLLSNTGGAQRSYGYEPYGTIRTQVGGSPTSFLNFTGEYLDPTGLYHLRARQYEPATGRFLTTDPLSPGVGAYRSAYGYAGNRPTVMIDPSGLTFTPSGEGQTAARIAASDLQFDLRPVDSDGTLRELASAAGKGSHIWEGPGFNYEIPGGGVKGTVNVRIVTSGSKYTVRFNVVPQFGPGPKLIKGLWQCGSGCSKDIQTAKRMPGNVLQGRGQATRPGTFQFRLGVIATPPIPAAPRISLAPFIVPKRMSCIRDDGYINCLFR